MKYVTLLSMCLLLPACMKDSARDGPGPQVIIETGYLSCTAPADGCQEALSCTNTAGEAACVEAPQDACSDMANCACAGDWVCGQRACVDVDGGFECRPDEDEPDPEACQPEACGQPPQVERCEDGSDSTVTCERAESGDCEWVVDACGTCAPEGAACDADNPCCGGADLTCNTAGVCARPFRFGIEINNDIEEDFWIQLTTEEWVVPWLTVYREGQEEPVISRFECGTGCNEDFSCMPPENLVLSITDGGFSGSHFFDWNRVLDVQNVELMCTEPVAAPAGNYRAVFCWSSQVQFEIEERNIGLIGDTVCREVTFSLPADNEAIYRVEGG